jgi:hypothetical protein
MIACLCTTACAYVTREAYLAVWDADGDGWPFDQDCAPNDILVHPYALDMRGDGCDTDCGTEPDADLDDWPDAADCGPDDPEAFPCSQFEVDEDGADDDCGGQDGIRADSCPGLDPDFPEDQEPPPCDPEPD